MTFRAPEPLRAEHRLDDFRCSSEEQTDWLHRHARQSTSMSTTKVFVVTTSDSQDVVAYYGWRMAELAVESAPPRLLKGAGRYPQPVALLARLGVDEGYERKGLGVALLRDVLLRFAEVAGEIGCRALLVHAESDAARAFYVHLIPEFETSPTDALHLMLLAKDIASSLRQ